LTRDEFERANADLFERVLEPIDAALDDCGLSPRDIDEIVLVGGSTQIPRVRQIVASFFGCELNFKFKR
jgi:molecular chaperone DnaK (HSP70)